MNFVNNQPESILFAQHGWSDNANDLTRLAQALVTDRDLVIAPSLGLLKTYWRIELLIKQVEKLAIKTIEQYPTIPFKIIGHSMGGLIWLEVLNRHPEWWENVHSVVVIGSPIGGANLARIIDPLALGIGIAKDLGTNRRSIAEKIAQHIPTLSLASDLGNGSDGMVTLEATKFDYAQLVTVKNIPHAHLKCHLDLVPIIHQFWSNPQINQVDSNLITKVIQKLKNVPGMTDANYQLLGKSQLKIQLPQKMTIRIAQNSLGVDHVFVTDANYQCLYAGYVGWLHKLELQKTLQEISIVVLNKNETLLSLNY